MNEHNKQKSSEPVEPATAPGSDDAAAEYAAQNAAHYAAEADQDRTAAGNRPADDAPPSPEDIVVALEAEKADLTDRYVRLAAEMENLRKRTERELADARKYAVSRFAADILGVSDNLDRARQSAGEGADSIEAIVEGIDVTARDLSRILEKHGVVKIQAVGEKFDPNRHQAMFEVPDESVPSGTVVQQVQEGYMIGERVLRAALVGVSKGGPKQPELVESMSDEAEAGSPAADDAAPDAEADRGDNGAADTAG